MKTKLIKIPLVIFALLGLVISGVFLTQTTNQVLASDEEPLIFEEPEFPRGLSMPGRIEGTGAFFEIKDSDYLNITLKNTEEIKVVLESIPRMISISIESVSSVASTNLTLEGLEPNKTYYKYQDSYKNLAVFVSDENGSYSWQQDLTKSHHIWFQEIKSTVFLPEDCSKYGTWDPSTKTCTLTQDLTESVEITANNITLDCNNYTLIGNQTGHGIYLYGKTEITIKNCNVNNFSYQIYLTWSTYNIFTGNSLFNSLGTGVYFNQSSNNNFTLNNVDSNKEGIYIGGYSKKNILIGNTLNSNQWGIHFSQQSTDNILKNNTLLGNQYNLGFYWWDPPEGFVQDIDISNAINGKPIYYLVNETDKEISGEAGFVGLVNSSNITVKNLNLTSNIYGVLLVSTENSRIENVQAFNNYIGVFLLNSSHNTFVGNRIFNNESSLTLMNPSMNSSFNIFIENTIKDNGGPLGFAYGTSNTFYHNNVINNGTWCGSQVYIRSTTGPSNNFDNGYPSGGNYWSDYAGKDEKSGPNQDQPGSDGIGDSSYDMKYYYSGNCFKIDQDRYPFMKENGWGAPPQPEKWAFAIITDLHIGRGYPDYDGVSYKDAGEGEDYYLTERLKKAVDWINTNKNKIDCGETKCPFQFLVALGDVTNTAEKSQFLKVKKILDKLNDPNGDGNISDGIPYVVVFGNHDIWPHTDDGNYDAESPLGEKYFDEIFWDSSSLNFQLIQKFFGNSWKRDNVHKNYKNFAFSYKEMNFIGLDFVSRDPWLFGPGVYSDADLSSETKTWLELQLDEHKEKPTVIFSHHPLTFEDLPYKLHGSFMAFSEDEINQIKEIIENKNVLANFGGHIHGVEKFLEIIDIFINANREYSSIDNTRVVTTESLMVGSNEEEPKGVIRIVEISEDNKINYHTIEGEFIALNPYISFAFEKPTELLPCVFFKAHAFTKREVSYFWAFGDGKTDVGEWDTHCYSIPGIYNVTLTVTDIKSGEKEKITREVEVKEGIIPKFLKLAGEMAEKMELISIDLGEDLTKIGQVFKDNVLIKVKHSEAKPVGLITVHFEQATQDIDLTNMIADFNLEKRKSILYMPTWPKEIEESKTFFIPSTGIGAVYICPEATSLNEITPLCKNIIIISVGESKNGLSATTIEYEGLGYYLVFGVKGAGGGEEFGTIGKAIKELNDYIQGLPDDAFKNNPQQRKNALKNKLEEVFVKIEHNEYQDAINKLQNDIRAKADGSVGGNPKDDWIIDNGVQNEICTAIDDLIVYLKSLF